MHNQNTISPYLFNFDVLFKGLNTQNLISINTNSKGYLSTNTSKNIKEY